MDSVSWPSNLKLESSSLKSFPHEGPVNMRGNLSSPTQTFLLYRKYMHSHCCVTTPVFKIPFPTYEFSFLVSLSMTYTWNRTRSASVWTYDVSGTVISLILEDRIENSITGLCLLGGQTHHTGDSLGSPVMLCTRVPPKSQFCHHWMGTLCIV